MITREIKASDNSVFRVNYNESSHLTLSIPKGHLWLWVLDSGDLFHNQMNFEVYSMDDRQQLQIKADSLKSGETTTNDTIMLALKNCLLELIGKDKLHDSTVVSVILNIRDLLIHGRIIYSSGMGNDSTYLYWDGNPSRKSLTFELHDNKTQRPVFTFKIVPENPDPNNDTSSYIDKLSSTEVGYLIAGLVKNDFSKL